MRRSMLERTVTAALVLLAGCAGGSTELTNTWHAPGAQPIRFQKVLAACICRDQATRRSVEDELVRHIPKAVAAYTILDESAARDTATARARVREAGFDGAVVMRLVGVDREQTYVPGTTYVAPAGYHSMWGYWGYGYSAAYQPGYVQETQVVRFDTNVYDVTQQKLVWASTSETYDPSSIREAVGKVVEATTTEMRREKVMAE